MCFICHICHKVFLPFCKLIRYVAYKSYYVFGHRALLLIVVLGGVVTGL